MKPLALADLSLFLDEHELPLELTVIRGGPVPCLRQIHPRVKGEVSFEALDKER